MRPYNAVVLVLIVLCPFAPRSSADAAAPPPVQMTGRAHPALAPFDDLMTSFLREHDVPGAVLAVGRDGRLMYARGFGVADRATGGTVEPDSLFRVASLSKPITAVAIFKLIESGRLKPDDRAFDLLKISPHLSPESAPDKRLGEITILHLLQHTAGFDRGKSFDPMFRSRQIAAALSHDGPAQPEHVIRYMLGRPLDFGPGERYAYSNFGYCVLGRVIEKVSGKTYEQYVQQEIFAAIGIDRPRIGRTLVSERQPGEVTYHPWKNSRASSILGKAEEVPTPYGAWYLEAMDAHGGWIASAPDLVRFAMALDANSKQPLLKPASVARMFARPAHAIDPDGPPNTRYYGCGWSVRPVGSDGKVNTWHTGQLSGTATLLVRRHDGLTWAVLFNTDTNAQGDYLISIIDPLIHRAADKVTAWPAHDLLALPAVER